MSFLNDDDRRARSRYKQDFDARMAATNAKSERSFEEIRPALAEIIEQNARREFITSGEITRVYVDYGAPGDCDPLKSLLSQTLQEKMAPLVAEVLKIPLSNVTLVWASKSEREGTGYVFGYDISAHLTISPPLR